MGNSLCTCTGVQIEILVYSVREEISPYLEQRNFYTILFFNEIKLICGKSSCDYNEIPEFKRADLGGTVQTN